MQQHFQFSFYADFISDFSYSKELSPDVNDFSGVNDHVKDLHWTANQIPKMYTPINSFDTLLNQRMVLIIWFIDELTGQYMTVGQANITLNQFQSSTTVNANGEEEVTHSLELYKVAVTLANKVVGQVDLEMCYRITDSVEELN